MKKRAKFVARLSVKMWPFISQLQPYLVFLQDAEKEKMKEKKNGCTDAGPRFVGISHVEALE